MVHCETILHAQDRFWGAGVELINGSFLIPLLEHTALFLDLPLLQFGNLCCGSFAFYNISGTHLWKCTSRVYAWENLVQKSLRTGLILHRRSYEGSSQGWALRIIIYRMDVPGTWPCSKWVCEKCPHSTFCLIFASSPALCICSTRPQNFIMFAAFTGSICGV